MKYHHYARYPFLWYQTTEEDRIVRENRAIIDDDVGFFSWDIVSGFQAMAKVSDGWTWSKIGEAVVDPAKALQAVTALPEDSIIFMKDFHRYFDPTQAASVKVIRQALNLKPHLTESSKTIAFVSALNKIPPELSNDVQIMDFEFPGPQELMKVLQKIVSDNGLKMPDNTDDIINALRGLTFEGASNALALSLAMHGEIRIPTLLEQKANQLKASEVMSFSTSKEKLKDLYGLDKMIKLILATVKDPECNGFLLYGVPGCGKSHVIKGISNEIGWPALDMNFSALRGKYQGDAETRLSTSFKSARAFGNVILKIDEIDKAVAGTGASDTDGGVGSRILGELLKEMEDHKGEGRKWFATANSLEDILHLSGGALQRRFDVIFFIDLPTAKEDLRGIAKIWSGIKGVQIPENFNLTHYSGADISKLASMMKMMKCSAEEASEYIIPYGKANGPELDRIREKAKGV
ncbi:MAG: AAA family ATPase, partial [Pseudomonadota bacterium]